MKKSKQPPIVIDCFRKAVFILEDGIQVEYYDKRNDVWIDREFRADQLEELENWFGPFKNRIENNQINSELSVLYDYVSGMRERLIEKQPKNLSFLNPRVKYFYPVREVKNCLLKICETEDTEKQKKKTFDCGNFSMMLWNQLSKSRGGDLMNNPEIITVVCTGRDWSIYE